MCNEYRAVGPTAFEKRAILVLQETTEFRQFSYKLVTFTTNNKYYTR
jgi:hypothetical protein